MRSFLKVWLFFALCISQSALGATGDIVSATVLGVSPHEGWVVSIEIEGWSAATSLAVVSGFGTTVDQVGNNPLVSSAKGSMTVVSQGYSESGGAYTLGTRNRTIYVSRAVQLAYPSQATIDTTTSGSNLVVKCALTDYVYVNDNTGVGNSGTAPTITTLSGLFTSNLGSSNAVTALTVTNNSTKVYPKVKAAWVDIPGGRVGSTYTGRLSCGHAYGQGQPVVGVQFILTDTAANTVTISTTEAVSEKSVRFPTLPRIQCYKGVGSTTALTDGLGITVDAIAYPYIGNAASRFVSSSFSATSGQQHLRPRFHMLDRSGTAYPTVYAYANPASPSGSPVASTTAATARANPYATCWAAIAGARAFILANYGKANNCDGAIIRLMDNSGAGQLFAWGSEVSSSSMVAPYAMLIIQPDPLNTSTVTFQNRAAFTQAMYCTRMRLENVIISPTDANQSNYISPVASDDWLVSTNCTYNCLSTSPSKPLYTSGMNNVITYEGQFNNWYVNAWRNCMWPTFAGIVTTNIATNPTAIMGFRYDATPTTGNVYQTGTEASLFGVSSAQSNGYVAFGEITHNVPTALGAQNGASGVLTNYYFGHIALHRWTGSVSAQPAMLFGNSNIDVFFEHITSLYQRWNNENEGLVDHPYDRVHFNGCAAYYHAYKEDVFGSNGTMTSAWAQLYGTSRKNDWNGKNGAPPNWDGLYSYLSSSGTGIFDPGSFNSNLDATPRPESVLIGIMAKGTATSKFDQDGIPIDNNGAGSTGAKQPKITLGSGLMLSF